MVALCKYIKIKIKNNLELECYKGLGLHSLFLFHNLDFFFHPHKVQFGALFFGLIKQEIIMI